MKQVPLESEKRASAAVIVGHAAKAKSTVNSAMVGQVMNDVGKLRTIALWFVLTISVPSFCACNTVAGLGKDMEKLGDKIEKKAEQKKRY